MEPLAQFYANETMREAMKAFQIQMLRELAADKAIGGEPTSGIREGNEAIIKSFDKLQELYGKIEDKEDYDPS